MLVYSSKNVRELSSLTFLIQGIIYLSPDGCCTKFDIYYVNLLLISILKYRWYYFQINNDYWQWHSFEKPY